MNEFLSIEEALLKDSTELYAELGTVVLNSSLGIGSPNPARNKLAGQSWIRANRENILTLICGHPAIIALGDTSDSSRERQIELASIIADTLSTKYTGMPVIAISVLVIREGIHLLCRDRK